MVATVRIPVFVSRPLDLSPAQIRSLRLVERRLRSLQFEPLTVESRDYPIDDPMTEVDRMNKPQIRCRSTQGIRQQGPGWALCQQLKIQSAATAGVEYTRCASRGLVSRCNDISARF